MIMELRLSASKAVRSGLESMSSYNTGSIFKRVVCIYVASNPRQRTAAA